MIPHLLPNSAYQGHLNPSPQYCDNDNNTNNINHVTARETRRSQKRANRAHQPEA
jgi:hypothetical protein